MSGPPLSSDATAWVAGREVRDDGIVSPGGHDPAAVAERILDAIEDHDGVAPAGALLDGLPVLIRDEARIVPLAWRPPEAASEVFPATANEIWTAVRSACEHRHGSGLSVGLEQDPPRNAYIRELARTGVRRADWWASEQSALVLVVHGEPVPAPLTASALHLVPLGWVSDRRPARRVPPTDLAWSPADIGRLGREH